MKAAIKVGDVRMVKVMTEARRMGRKHTGYSYDYVRYVLNGKRRNPAIHALHDELVALRTPKEETNPNEPKPMPKKTQARMSADIGKLITKLRNDGTEYSPTASLNIIATLLYNYGQRLKEPDPITGVAPGSRGCMGNINSSVAWRYLNAGCDPSKVSLDGLPEAYKAVRKRIDEGRIRPFRNMQAKLGVKDSEQLTEATRLAETLKAANAELLARNAALEENTMHVQAELHKREEQLVELGKDAGVIERENEALHAANNELMAQVEELQGNNSLGEELRQERCLNQGYKELNETLEAENEELKAANARLRACILEQATTYAATLKALVQA